MGKFEKLLEAVNRMDRYKMETFFEKVFGYIALYILLIGVFSCLIALILRLG